MDKPDFAAERRTRQLHIDVIDKQLRQIPRLRFWALTPEQKLQLSAIHKAAGAHARDGKTPDEVFATALMALEKHVTGLFREDLKTPEIPQPPRDLITGQPMLQMPENETEKLILRQRFPAWYSWLERRMKNPITQLVEHIDEK